MILDTQLELLPFESHVGTGIGGVPPTSYGSILYGIAVGFYTNGPAYANWLAAVHRPVLPNTGKLSLSFNLSVDPRANECAQALEFDTRVSIQDGSGKWNYNGSSQFNQAGGGAWQIVDANGDWVDTGFRPGKFTPLVKYPIKIDYSFDVTKHTSSVLGISIGGDINQRFLVPAHMQNLAASNLGWADSCSLQVQLDLNSSGGAYSIYMRDIQYEWS